MFFNSSQPGGQSVIMVNYNKVFFHRGPELKKTDKQKKKKTGETTQKTIGKIMNKKIQLKKKSNQFKNKQTKKSKYTTTTKRKKKTYNE